MSGQVCDPADCHRCDPWGDAVPGKAKCHRKDPRQPAPFDATWVSVTLGGRCVFPNLDAPAPLVLFEDTP